MKINQALAIAKRENKSLRQVGWPSGVNLRWIEVNAPDGIGLYLVSGEFADIVGRYHLTAPDVAADWSVKLS